jgi:hypothetical protein
LQLSNRQSIARRVRRVDCRPADVLRSGAVCGSREATQTAAERIPVGAVPLTLYVPTLSTGARRGARVYEHNRHSCKRGLVDNELTELVIKLQEEEEECITRLWRRLTLVRCLIPLKSSRAIPEPVRCAFRTIRLLITWFTLRAPCAVLFMAALAGSSLSRDLVPFD